MSNAKCVSANRGYGRKRNELREELSFAVSMTGGGGFLSVCVLCVQSVFRCLQIETAAERNPHSEKN